MDERFRTQALKDWPDGKERWMRRASSTTGDRGIAVSTPTWFNRNSAILVDEAQDLGTLELAIIRRLAHHGENDLFLCGDAAQTIHTKSTDQGSRYRYLRAIRAVESELSEQSSDLAAANQVLTQALRDDAQGRDESGGPGARVRERFSSPKPLLLKADSRREELERGLGFLSALVDDGPINQRYCLPYAVAASGDRTTREQLALPILAAISDVRSGRIFGRTSSKTKGFEFDAVVRINCSSSSVLSSSELAARGIL